MRSALSKLLNLGGAPVPLTQAGPYHAPLLTGRNDLDAYIRTYGSAGTVHSIVTLLARSSAKAEWSLFRPQPQDGRVRYTTRDAGSDQRVQVVQHQALKVWGHPNDFTTTHDFVYGTQQYLELTGEAYWLVVKTGAIPTALWLISPARMVPVPSPANFLTGWVYLGPNGERIPLGVDEVIQLKYPNPMDPYRGIGPVQAVLVDIDAYKYSGEWNRNFFINSAQPAGVVTVPTFLTDDEFNELTNRWREAHQGVNRAHRVAFLDGGVTFQPFTASMKDMEFTNLRNLSRDVIREAWGIHKVMLGVSDDVNRANAQTGEEVHVAWQVEPRLRLLRTTLNQRFLPMFGATGQNVEFDYDGIQVQNREQDNAELTSKSQAAQLLISTGFDPHDVLEMVGLPDMAFAAAVSPAAPSAGAVDAGDVGEPGEQDLTARLRRVLGNGHLPVEVG